MNKQNRKSMLWLILGVITSSAFALVVILILWYVGILDSKLQIAIAALIGLIFVCIVSYFSFKSGVIKIKKNF